MQLTGNVTNQDLTSEIDLLCDSDSTSYTLADKVRRINYSLEELIGKIINADGTWQFDDTNFTTEPIGRGLLVDGQTNYSFASEYLDIEEIDILTSDGQYRRIKPIDPMDLGNQSIDEYFGNTTSTTATGFPEYYDLQGDTIRLYPAPAATDVTLADGLQVKFHRTADLFTTSDTSQEPALPSPYHVMLAYMASIPYCMSYKKDRVVLYQNKVVEMTRNLIKHYGRREKDRRKVMTNRSVRFR